MSHFIRKTVLEKEIYEVDLKPLRDLYVTLSAATNKLNQIAKRVNQTGVIYKNDIAYIVCEVKIFKNDISIGTTNSIINESYIKQIIKDPSDNSTIISLEGSFSIIVNENYDDFIIEFFRPDPIAINEQPAERKRNKIGFLTY